VRICPRGHHCPRTAQYCAECGSADLSTPAPPASLLYRISGAVLYGLAGAALAALLLAAVLSALSQVDWHALSGPLVGLLLMLGVLYWTTTLLPGPVKKLGRAAGRQAMKSMRKNKRP